MKRALSLFLALTLCLSLCFSLSACGDDGIKLTLDNYDDYLDIHANVVGGGELIQLETPVWLGTYYKGYKHVHDDFFVALGGYISSKSVAPNFNYSNVNVTVKFTGTVLAFEKNSDPDNPKTVELPFKFEGTFSLTVGGANKNDTVIYNLGNYMFPGGTVSTSGYIKNINYEITAISGTVTPV